MKIKPLFVTLVKWTGIAVASILLLMLLLPMLFPGTIEQQIRKIANKSLAAKVDFSHSKLSFFTHFPSLTASFDELSISGSEPFKEENLLKAKQVAFGINVYRLLFANEVKIDKLFVSEADVNIKVNEKGEANYNIYIAPKDQPKSTKEEGTAIRLDRIDFENCHIRYRDRSAKVVVETFGFNYVGKGDLSEEVFDLQTNATVDSVDFYYDEIPYLKKKFVSADLITRINTNSLSFILQKNELRINKLPLEFTGLFTILNDGYKIDIDAASKNSSFRDLLSVMPPQYLSWLEETDLDGTSNLSFQLKGRYNAAQKVNPNLKLRLVVNDGAVAYREIKKRLKDFGLDLAINLPDLDSERLKIDLKNLRFKVGEKDFFNAYLKSEGLSEMKINANVTGALDLAALDAALGLDVVDMRGILKTNITANGIFSADKFLFPKTKGGLTLQNGYLLTNYYPNPITNITCNANVFNELGTFEGVHVAITPASFVFEGNPVYVSAKLSNYEDLNYDVQAKGALNVGRIYKVFATKGIDVTGYAKADFSLKGKESDATKGAYSKLDNKGTIQLKNIKTTSELFPKAFFIREGLFRFANEKMFFERFTANYGQSDFAINGHLLNTINYFIESNGTLSGTFNVTSKLLNVDEFMALKEGENKDLKVQVKDAKEDHPKLSGVIVLPRDLNIKMTTAVDKVAYNGLNLTQFSGAAGIKNGEFTLQNVGFDIIGARVGIEARYKDESPISANFEAHFKASEFDVQRAYKEIPMFRDMASAAEKAKGIIGMDYVVKGDLDGNMAPIYESLEGGGAITLRNIQISGLRMFTVASEKTSQKVLDNPNLSGVTIESTIDNNLIDVKPFTFTVSLFRPTIKGTTSFDGLLDLRIRLGLPPLGLIGIPITVTGTHTDPKIKVFSKTGKTIEDAIYNTMTNQVIREERVAPEKKKTQKR